MEESLSANSRGKSTPSPVGIRKIEMRPFYRAVLPIVWATAAVTSYFHPGDEYGLFVGSTIAGSWVCFVLPEISHLSKVLWIILTTGVVVLAIVGIVMDRLHVSKRVWLTLFGLCFAGVLLLTLHQYPSLDRAIGKNGSLTAYVAGACNVGLYLSIVSAFIINAVAATMHRIMSHRTAKRTIVG